MNKQETKHAILKKIKEAESLVPQNIEPDLPPTQLLPNIPEWHSYEHKIWKLGEDIRQLFLLYPSLKSDKEIHLQILDICLNPNSKRGRQSFIMLLGYKQFSDYAEVLITQVNDEFVTGHILDTILKMKVSGYGRIMENYINYNITWIRNVAKRYLKIFPLE